jgi:hypothetical protein
MQKERLAEMKDKREVQSETNWLPNVLDQWSKSSGEKNATQNWNKNCPAN